MSQWELATEKCGLGGFCVARAASCSGSVDSPLKSKAKQPRKARPTASGLGQSLGAIFSRVEEQFKH